MFKLLLTLARGRSEDATQAFADANALTLLRQQLRDAAAGVQKTRKALAVVMAYAEQEKASLAKLEGQAKDLESRALAALSQDQESLAVEAADAIADLEADITATRKTIDTYTTDIDRLRKILKESEAQLTELNRGHRLAKAGDRALNLRGTMPAMTTSDLADATSTLQRLQDRQIHAEATLTAMEELSTQANADSVSDRLAKAGCGPAKQSDGAAVLDRLRALQNA